MEVRHLQYFLLVAQTGTIGRAAKHFNVSQPAISKSISRLEAILNVRLFERTAKGMVPTEFGLALVERARHISNEARRINEDFDALRGSGQGMLSIGAGTSHGASLVPRAVLAVQTTRPHAKFSIMAGSSETLLPALQHGVIDILVGAVFANPTERELASELIAHDRVIAVARVEHPLHRKGPPTLEDLAKAEWVLGDRDDSLRLQLNTLFANKGVTLSQPRLITTSVPTIKSLLNLADLIAFLPESLVAEEISAGTLKRMERDELIWLRPVHVLYSQNRPLTRLGSAMVRHLKAATKEIPGYTVI